MKKFVTSCALILTCLTLILTVLYCFSHHPVLLTSAISLMTTAYHFDMRLAVGVVIDSIFHNRIDESLRWFQVHSYENKLYEILQVKNWKDKMPTFSPDTFSLRMHSLEEIAQATCQSEIVHEIIVILSFAPILFIPLFGKPLVFIITSILAALFDLSFVIIQRYNRARLMNIINKKKRRD